MPVREARGQNCRARLGKASPWRGVCTGPLINWRGSCAGQTNIERAKFGKPMKNNVLTNSGAATFAGERQVLPVLTRLRAESTAGQGAQACL